MGRVSLDFILWLSYDNTLIPIFPSSFILMLILFPSLTNSLGLLFYLESLVCGILIDCTIFFSNDFLKIFSSLFLERDIPLRDLSVSLADMYWVDILSLGIERELFSSLLQTALSEQ